MTAASEVTRANIRAQGFSGLDDETYAQINYPLRLSPALCMIWAAVGTAMALPTVLWALAPFAALGAVFPSHPFDVQVVGWSLVAAAFVDVSTGFCIPSFIVRLFAGKVGCA